MGSRGDVAEAREVLGQDLDQPGACFDTASGLVEGDVSVRSESEDADRDSIAFGPGLEFFASPSRLFHFDRVEGMAELRGQRVSKLLRERSLCVGRLGVGGGWADTGAGAAPAG